MRWMSEKLDVLPHVQIFRTAHSTRSKLHPFLERPLGYTPLWETK